MGIRRDKFFLQIIEQLIKRVNTNKYSYITSLKNNLFKNVLRRLYIYLKERFNICMSFIYTTSAQSY